MKTIVTHSGDFHMDDLLAVAVVELYEGSECNIVRTRDAALFDNADYVLDIGQVYHIATRRFDHHQEGGAGFRETQDGTPYATCGLVWKEFGTTICDSALLAEMLDDRIFKPIDALDNGIEIANPIFDTLRLPLITDLVYIFRPTWKEEDNNDELFRISVDVAKKYILRTIKVLKDNIEAEDIVRAAYENSPDKRVIALDYYVPYQDVLMRYPEPLFVVYPSDSQEGMWRVTCIRKERFTFENRNDLKKEWAGKISAELVKLSGIPTINFVHNKLFTGAAGTREDALEMAYRSIN